VGRFYRVGGGNRIAGFLLAIATTGLLVIGAGPIAFLRESHFMCILFMIDWFGVFYQLLWLLVL